MPLISALAQCQEVIASSLHHPRRASSEYERFLRPREADGVASLCIPEKRTGTENVMLFGKSGAFCENLPK